MDEGQRDDPGLGSRSECDKSILLREGQDKTGDVSDSEAVFGRLVTELILWVYELSPVSYFSVVRFEVIRARHGL